VDDIFSRITFSSLESNKRTDLKKKDMDGDGIVTYCAIH
jgi:hypothetical protein